MNITAFIRLLKQHLIWFVILPCVTGAVAWYTTRNETKVYKSQATLYTGLSSGYSLMTDKGGLMSDRSSSAFDNMLTTLYSKETMMNVSVSLLTDHLRLQQPDSLVLGGGGFQKLQQAIPPDLRMQLPIEGDRDTLWLAIDNLAKSTGDNPVKSLLLKSDSYYSLGQLTEKLKATSRKATNDVLLMEYETDDPGVAQNTLRYAIKFLNDRYSTLKTTETNSVVGYYESKLQKAKEKLDEAEAALKAFNVRHGVLDFDEEARNVASSRESMVNEYNQELMRRNAAKAALDALDKRAGQQSTVRTATTDLTNKQKKLTDAESQLANARAYGQPKSVINRLQAAVNQAAEELKISAQKYDAVTSTSDAVPQQTIANDRLAKLLEYEESSARLETYQKRLGEYQAKTENYTPLGSQLRQLQRQLSVAEKEYLDLLQNVDMSQTRRQDVKIGGTMTILDAPDFPLVPQPTKRWQLVAIGIGVGLFLAMLLMALRFWLDKRINSPEQAETLIGMPVTALFPTVKKPKVFSNATLATRSMFEQLVNAINIEIAQVTAKPYPPIITLFSIPPRQGKTWVADGLNTLYASADQQVAYCYPRITGKEKREFRNGITYFPYTIRPDFMNVTSLDYLIDHEAGFEASQYDRIVFELPNLLNNQIPVYLLKNSALSLLIVDANSKWGRAEKQLLTLYDRVTNQPILLILNNVVGNYIDVAIQSDKNRGSSQSVRSLQTHRNVP